ncbi:hypothetical protein [Pseudonocardia endophytica]|uniref:Peptide subunit release factor 1 (ERF1) n=1 Tax=Pseudonocardia endophytica TaxID=401976 RepID=A0A4R1HYM1_PSEEN|nr:hypothetical protein [Pseudonocardia endophytica]TCK25970.1 hypothetical protein EV378_1797 [Pseudonocardia endophytica]
MRLNWLRSLTDDPGPFATVVLDATSDEPKGPDEVRLRWRNLRDDLERQGAQDRVLQVLDDAVDAGDPPDGTAARVLVAGSGGLLLDRFVEVPPSGSGTATWSDVPDLTTVTAAVPEEIRAVAVFVDDTGGKVRGPGDAEVEDVTGDSAGPVHKANTAGPGEGGADARVEETWKRNARAVAERVEKITSGSAAQQIVLTGTSPARARLLDELSPHTAELVYEVEHSGGDFPDDLPATLLTAADALREARRAQSVERFAAAAGRSDGVAVTGLADVLAAVRAQAVDTLVLDPAAAPDDEVWIGARGEPSELAADRDELTALGTDPDARVAAVPAVIRAVAAADGDLVLTGPDDDVTLRAGVGALLRFPVGPAS